MTVDGCVSHAEERCDFTLEAASSSLKDAGSRVMGAVFRPTIAGVRHGACASKGDAVGHHAWWVRPPSMMGARSRVKVGRVRPDAGAFVHDAPGMRPHGSDHSP